VFSQQVEQYPGQRDLDAFKSYLNKMVEQKDEKVESEEEKVPEKKPCHSTLDTLFRFQANQFLLLLLIAACLAEKQQLPIF
jgi:hypothetical protein